MNRAKQYAYHSGVADACQILFRMGFRFFKEITVLKNLFLCYNKQLNGEMNLGISLSFADQP